MAISISSILASAPFITTMIMTGLLVASSTTPVSAAANNPESMIQNFRRNRNLIASPEMCAANDSDQLGSDIYVSLFSPCEFKFYTDSSCDGDVYSVEYSKVLGWPDSCVANGPVCYDLNAHPSLANFTLGAQLSLLKEGINWSLPNITEGMKEYYDYYYDYSNETVMVLNGGLNATIDELDFSYYTISFPPEAQYVSVDCSQDYQDAMEAVEKFDEEVGPLAEAFTFFATMILVGSISAIVCCCICFCGICRGSGRRSGYTTVPPDSSQVSFEFTGPPVQATDAPKLEKVVVV